MGGDLYKSPPNGYANRKPYPQTVTLHSVKHFRVLIMASSASYTILYPQSCELKSSIIHEAAIQRISGLSPGVDQKWLCDEVSSWTQFGRPVMNIVAMLVNKGL